MPPSIRSERSCFRVAGVYGLSVLSPATERSADTGSPSGLCLLGLASRSRRMAASIGRHLRLGLLSGVDDRHQPLGQMPFGRQKAELADRGSSPGATGNRRAIEDGTAKICGVHRSRAQHPLKEVNHRVSRSSLARQRWCLSPFELLRRYADRPRPAAVNECSSGKPPKVCGSAPLADVLGEFGPALYAVRARALAIEKCAPNAK